MRRLQIQLLLVLLAAISVSALSFFLILNAIDSAESVVLADTHRALSAANNELIQQYQNRVNSDSSWAALPEVARDVSLRAISQVVLRAYPGVEGGFSVDSRIAGYSYPTHGSPSRKTDVPAAESPDIALAIRQAGSKGTAERVLRGPLDLVVIQAMSRNGVTGWTMKRLAGIADPGRKRRQTLLIWLVVAALFSIAGTLAIVIGLRRGLSEIQSGLSRLESDFNFSLPARAGELGAISGSVNRMAATRRSLEAELRREDKLRAIGRVVANIAHEIRNPLNSIRLTMQMLKYKQTRNEIERSDLDLVIEEVDRLNALLTDLLTFRESQRPQLEIQPVMPVVERTLRLLEGQANSIQFHLDGSDPQATARFDATHLTQVLTNLLLNSIAALDRRGQVTLRVRSEARQVSIVVEDDGPGVSPEVSAHLFEPFFTTRDGGTGLGLAVSRELMTNMGGTLAHRNGGPGATFEITLAK